MTIYINTIAVFLKTDDGVRAIFDDEGNYEFGEFIAAEDFNDDAFTAIETDQIDPINFDGDEYYQRELTEDIYQYCEFVADRDFTNA